MWWRDQYRDTYIQVLMWDRTSGKNSLLHLLVRWPSVNVKLVVRHNLMGFPSKWIVVFKWVMEEESTQHPWSALDMQGQDTQPITQKQTHIHWITTDLWQTCCAENQIYLVWIKEDEHISLCVVYILVGSSFTCTEEGKSEGKVCKSRA